MVLFYHKSYNSRTWLVGYLMDIHFIGYHETHKPGFWINTIAWNWCQTKCDVLNFWWYELMNFHPKDGLHGMELNVSPSLLVSFCLHWHQSSGCISSSRHTLMLEEWNEFRWIVMKEWECWRGSLKCRSINPMMNSQSASLHSYAIFLWHAKYSDKPDVTWKATCIDSPTLAENTKWHFF